MFGRLAYTHKTHEKMADGYVRRYRTVKVVEIALSALAAGSLVLALLGDSRCATVVGAIVSTTLLGVTLYFKEATLGELAQKHSIVASKLWGARERLLSLIIDMRDGRPVEDIRKERDELNVSLEEIYRNAPRTDAGAYRRAQQALKADEELYFSDEELNKMLPKQLRD